MKKRILTLVLVCAGAALLPVACTQKEEQPAKADATAPADSNPTPEPDAGTEPAGWPGGKLCSADADCAGADAGACITWDGQKCDKTHKDPSTNKGRCVVKLVSGKQCAPGHVHGGAAPDGTNLVHACDASACNWDTTIGTPCGADGGPCCVGGCNGNLHCSSLVGAVGATCNP